MANQQSADEPGPSAIAARPSYSADERREPLPWPSADVLSPAGPSARGGYSQRATRRDGVGRGRGILNNRTPVLPAAPVAAPAAPPPAAHAPPPGLWLSSKRETKHTPTANESDGSITTDDEALSEHHPLDVRYKSLLLKLQNSRVRKSVMLKTVRRLTAQRAESREDSHALLTKVHNIQDTLTNVNAQLEQEMHDHKLLKEAFAVLKADDHLLKDQLTSFGFTLEGCTLVPPPPTAAAPTSQAIIPEIGQILTKLDVLIDCCIN